MTEIEIPERAQCDYLKIDADFDDKPKLLGLAVEHGHLACYYLILLMAKMVKATNAEVSRSAAFGVGARLGIKKDRCIKILAYCLAEGILEEHGPMLTNSRVIEQQEDLAQYRRRSSTRTARHRQRVRNALHNGDETVTSRECNGESTRLSLTHTHSLIDNNKNGALPRLPLPAHLETPSLRQALENWQRKLLLQGVTLDEITWEAQMMRFANEPARLEAALKFSTGRARCVNLIEEDQKSDASGDKKNPKKSQLFELVIDLVRAHGQSGYDAAMAKIPAEVLPAVRKIGWRTFCESRAGDPQLKARFFEALA